MKKIFKPMSALLTLLALTFAFTLTSCGDDDKDEPAPAPGATHPARIGIAYALDLTDAYWDFFDIEVTYTEVSGNIVKKIVNKGWTYAADIKYEDAPATPELSVKALPKTNIPEISETKTYEMKHSYKFYIYALNENNKEEKVICSMHPTQVGSTLVASQMINYVKKEHSIGSFSWPLK